MTIEKNKYYKVEKYTKTGETDYGKMLGVDVKAIIGRCEYDSFFGMFFNKNGSVGFKIYEI